MRALLFALLLATPALSQCGSSSWWSVASYPARCSQMNGDFWDICCAQGAGSLRLTRVTQEFDFAHILVIGMGNAVPISFGNGWGDTFCFVNSPLLCLVPLGNYFLPGQGEYPILPNVPFGCVAPRGTEITFQLILQDTNDPRIFRMSNAETLRFQ